MVGEEKIEKIDFFFFFCFGKLGGANKKKFND